MKYQDARKLKPGCKFHRKVYRSECYSMYNGPYTYTAKEVIVDEAKRQVTIKTTYGCDINHKEIWFVLEY